MPPVSEPSPKRRYTVALIQFSPRLGAVDDNLSTIEDYLRQARERGADLAVFPELALSGYLVQDLAGEVYLTELPRPERNRRWWDRLLDLSRTLPLVVGLPYRDGSGLYIASALLSEGSLLALHRKVYLPTYGLFQDQRFFDRGQLPTLANTEPFGRLGLLICEDAWHPLLVNATALMGAEVLVIVSASPAGGAATEVAYSAEWWATFCSVYAKLFGCYVLFANRTGSEDGVIYSGSSRVVDPFGRVVVEADGKEGRPAPLEDGMLIAELDLEEVFRARTILPLMSDEDPRLLREIFDRLTAGWQSLPPAASGKAQSGDG